MNRMTSIDSLDAALHGLDQWLLSGPVLRAAEAPDPAASRSKAGAGVVNYLSQDAIWNGLYPEICGYYLQFLIHAAPRGTDDERYRQAASRVAAWLDAKGGPAAEPLTLYFRDPADSDWRNDCLFAFDLAIILRGLLSVQRRWPDLLPEGLVARYTASIARITSGGRLGSHLLRPGAGANPVPVKWSTTEGVHHVKAVAALGDLETQALEDTGLGGVIEATLRDEETLLARDGESRMRELHPFLYSIEGWLTVWARAQDPRAIGNAARSFTMAVRQCDPHSGAMPPVAGARNAVVRADVLGQMLRAGLVLDAADQLDAPTRTLWHDVRPVLENNLLSRLSPEGGIMFDTVGLHRNAWASMFGWQALRFARDAQASTLDPVRAAASII